MYRRCRPFQGQRIFNVGRHTRSCKANYDLYIWTSRQVLKLHVFLDMYYTTHPIPSLWGVKASLPAFLSLHNIITSKRGLVVVENENGTALYTTLGSMSWGCYLPVRGAGPHHSWSLQRVFFIFANSRPVPIGIENKSFSSTDDDDYLDRPQSHTQCK